MEKPSAASIRRVLAALKKKPGANGNFAAARKALTSVGTRTGAGMLACIVMRCLKKFKITHSIQFSAFSID
jgi:hypothetical protein